MDDPDATAAVPGPTPPGGGRLSDAALGALFDAASPAFATQPATSSRHWQPPTVEVLQQALPQYEISAFIARGGMGAVYQGVQRSLHRPVAVKVLPPEMEEGDLQFAERFKREAQSMAQLSHPNIVAVYDAGETSDGLLYFVMEYIEGTDVARLIASERNLDPQRAMSITSSVCDALAFAHEAGIIHRDIKPSNIMIDRKGRVKVADFGLAKAVSAEDGTLLTISRVAVGTPDFIAPEAHIAGVQVDQRADLYAVGVMLYQMLTGRIPRGRFDPPSSLIPRIDPRLDAIVDKAMQTERDKRYSPATEMKTDVERVSQGSVTDGSADTPVRPHQTGGEAAKGQKAHRSVRTPLLIAAGFIALAVGEFFLAKSKLKPGAAAGRSAAPALPSEAASAPEQVPGAAGPGASTAAYPPGQWVEVFSKPEDVPPNTQGAADLQWSEGWLVPGRMPLRLACPVADTNQRVRARFQFRGQDMYENFLQLRGKGPAGYVFRLTTDGQCTIALMKPGGSGAVSGPLFAGGRPARETEIIAKTALPAPLKAGDEYRLEFLAIGSRLIGRFNGQVICEASDTRLPAGQSSIYGYAPMRDIAVMALDKLPEAEALKAVGVDATAPTTHVWRDALAEPPLNVVATRANDPGGSFLFPINRHWLFPSTKVTAGMVRWRGVMDGSRWPVLFVTESNGSGIKADVFDVEMKAGLLDARNPDELRTLAKSMPVEALMNPGRHQAELALLRLGGRLHMLIDGKVVVDCADPLSGPVRFGFITHSDKPSTTTLDYLVLDGLSEAEALKVAGVDATAGGAPAPQSAWDPKASRRVAEQALRLGAHNIVTDQNGKQTTGTKLPEGDFRIVGLSFPPTAVSAKIMPADLLPLLDAVEIEVLTLQSCTKALSEEACHRIAQLPNLKRLTLQGTNLQDEWLQQISASPTLEGLTLIQTQVTDAGVAKLAGLRSLKKLLVSDTKVTGEAVAALPTAAKLRLLNIAGITKRSGDADLEAVLKVCTSLEWLEVGSTVGAEALRDIGRLRALRALLLKKTTITPAHIQQLATVPLLAILGLGDCQVEDAAWAALPSLKQLTTLNLKNVPRTPAMEAVLKEFNPPLREEEQVGEEGARIVIAPGREAAPQPPSGTVGQASHLPTNDAPATAGGISAGGAPAPLSTASRYPVGQWVRPYQKATDIHQKWFDAGAKWEEGWITPGAGFNQSISLGAPNAQGRNWGARARIRCGGGFAGIVLRRNGRATSNTVSNYEFRVTKKGGAEFVRGQGRGSVSGADRKPLGDPFPIPLIDGQVVLIEAFAVGDTLYGRVDGKVFSVKTDGMLKEGGFEVATQIMPVGDIEFINLDGLTEAEAKKAVGVGE